MKADRNRALLSEIDQLKKKIANLESENDQLKKKIAKPETRDKSPVTWGREKGSRMSGEEIKILQAIGDTEGQTTLQLSQVIAAGEQKMKYFLNRLFDKGLAYFQIVRGQEKTYYLTDEGRAWLYDADLLD